MRKIVFILSLLSLATSALYAQSTGTIQGTVSDSSGAAVPNASITARNTKTGEERASTTESSGLYALPSLSVGTYRLEVRARGLQTTAASSIEVSVGSVVRSDFTMKVQSSSEIVEVTAGAPTIEAASVTMGAVVDQRTVQEIPLNGRHFVDLALLIPGSVTPPANGFLTAPLRGQGSFSFNSAGGREDSVNFMINGINLSDPIQNQITFQPTINTIEEFKVDNQTFSAEYGRNSGSIVNIATRSGGNVWHGEAYEFLRNNALDARNFSNPTFTSAGANPQSPFKRNQFGGDGGGAIIKDRTFIFLSYEALRQRQAVPLSAITLTDAQRAQGLASPDPVIRKLIPLIPAANSGTNQFTASAVAPVNISQGTANLSHVFSSANRLNAYYAIQKDERNEPPSTDGNSFPGGGDMRNGTRQLLTLNDVWTISPTMVNEARLGFNRIHITFLAANNLSASDFGINSGVTAAIGLPQITVSGAFTFGGIGGFPQGRGDTTGVVSDTLSWIRGNHSIKFGGEYRRANTNNFSYTPGTFSFPSIAAFLADQATSFTANTSNRSNRVYANSLGGFATDTWKIRPTVTLSLGFRYDWFGTPTEAQNRFVVFDPTTVALQNAGVAGGPSRVHNQNNMYQPRLGLTWDPFKTGKTIIRTAYAITADQPNFGLVTGLASNPPYAFPVSFSPTAATPFVTFANAITAAGGTVSPTSVAANYKDAYVQQWNFNVEQQWKNDYGFMVGYVGNKGTHLNIARNYNQPINGVRPYARLAANSAISPGVALSNIIVYEGVGNSDYNALWVTANKRFSKGLQFNSSYTYSKSIDYNSRNQQGLTVQNSYNLRGDRGLSDFDARNRFVISALYELPFKRSRLVEGWQFSLIETVQSGNPINFRLSNTSFAGAAVLRPNVTGTVQTGFTPSTNGSATSATYIQNPAVFINQGTTAGTTLGFGNLGRNVVIGPGYSTLDFAITKNTKITERVKLQIRADAFDLPNQTNFTQPVSTIGSGTLGLITGGTRFPAGDGGTSRQLQLVMKFIF